MLAASTEANGSRKNTHSHALWEIREAAAPTMNLQEYRHEKPKSPEGKNGTERAAGVASEEAQSGKGRWPARGGRQSRCRRCSLRVSVQPSLVLTARPAPTQNIESAAKALCNGAASFRSLTAMHVRTTWPLQPCAGKITPRHYRVCRNTRFFH